MDNLIAFRRSLSFLRPFRGTLVVAFFFGLGMAATGLVLPLLARILFDYAYPFRDLALLNTTAIAILVASSVYFLLGLFSDYVRLAVSQGATASLTLGVYDAIQRLPLSYHLENQPRDLITRLTEDVPRTIALAAGVWPALLLDGGRIIAILAITLAINAKLFLLMLLALPLMLLETRLLAWRRRRAKQDFLAINTDIVDRAEERLAGIRTIKAFAQERNEALSFDILLRRRFRATVRGRVLEVARTFAHSVALQLWSIALLWFLSVQVIQGTLTIGEIVALALYAAQMGGPMRSLSMLPAVWRRGLLSKRRLDEVLDAPRDEAGGRHLSFTAAPDEEILHDVNVRFLPQQLTAIAGADEGGKAVLVNHLLRFLDPGDGMILIGGQGIAEVRVHALQGKVGIIEQDAILFDGTIMDNLLYGNEGLERGDAMRAARLAGAHDFIERLPGGYDAPVGRSGEFLSAGQRQRVAIARTLLRDPAIIIFDEAGAGIDAESELRIQQAIVTLRQTKTVIALARRLATLKAADTILLLEEGRFVEEGNFDALLDKRGAFFRYYWRTFGGLAAFRGQLELELERAARYGSRFCLAALTLASARDIAEREGLLAAEQFTAAVDLLLKKRIRIGDNSVALDADTIVILLPEIDAQQLHQFFQRMQSALPQGAAELPAPLATHDLRFIGTSITKKGIRSSDELLSRLVARAKNIRADKGMAVIAEEELSATPPAGGGT